MTEAVILLLMHHQNEKATRIACRKLVSETEDILAWIAS
jgi:hypothetical protein